MYVLSITYYFKKSVNICKYLMTVQWSLFILFSNESTIEDATTAFMGSVNANIVVTWCIYKVTDPRPTIWFNGHYTQRTLLSTGEVLGSVFLRRHMQRVVQSEDSVRVESPNFLFVCHKMHFVWTSFCFWIPIYVISPFFHFAVAFYSNKREECGSVQSGITAVPHLTSSTYNAISAVESSTNSWLWGILGCWRYYGAWKIFRSKSKFSFQL